MIPIGYPPNDRDFQSQITSHHKPIFTWIMWSFMEPKFEVRAIYIRSMQGYAPAAPHSYGFKWYSASSRGSGKWPLIGSTFCYSIEGTVFIFLFLKVNIFSGYPPVTKHGNWKSPNSMEADRWENQL